MKIDVNQFLKPCSCGRKHEIVVDDIIIDSGAINQLPEILKRPAYADKKSLVMICDENTYEAAGKQVEALVPGLKKIVLDPDNLHANEHGVEAAKKGLDEIGDVDMMIAVGSGTVHDITRFHAYEMKIPFFSVPTAASVDGFVSTVAAMTWHGFKKSFTAVSPVVVIADTDIFKKAPLRLTASGVSDLLGKYTALADWKITHLLTGEYICKEICDMEYQALDSLISSLDGLKTGDTKAYEDTYSVYRCMKKNIKKDSIITLIGGGNSGSEYEFIEQPRRFILKKFRNTKIISFPQSYIYKKSKVAEVRQNEFIKLCNKCKKITLIAREEYTYKKYLEMLKDRRKVIMTPDIVFSMNVNNIEINNRKDRVFLVLRNDKEKFHTKLNANDIQKYVKNIFSECVIKDTCDFKNVSANKMQVLEEYIQELAKSKIVVTDRLHGMILSYITDTPCIVLRNNNHKIESTYYTWLNKCSNVKLIEQDDQELLIQEIKKMKNNINCEVLTLDEKFEPLIKLIKDFVGEV